MPRQWLNIFLVSVFTVFLSACGGGSFYQPLGYSGGYTDTRLDANTLRVTYRGNFTMPQETVQNYLIYRCAQLTVQYDYDYFVIISTSSRPVVSSYTSPSVINTYRERGEKNSYSIVTPGQTSYFSKEIANAVIKLYKGIKPAGLANAFSAKEVLRYMKPAIKIKPN